MKRLPGTLTLFFPAYNDAPSLPALLASAFEVAPTCADDFEVLVIDDGSRDQTPAVLVELQGRYGPRLRVVTHAVNRGYGGALRTGFTEARGDYVFYTDGDGQYDLRDLPALTAALPAEKGWANGYKMSRHDPLHRVLIGQAYCRFVRLLFGIRLRDVDCDFRLFRRADVAGLALTSTSGTICVELVALLERAGLRAAEAPVRHLPRLHGRSQFFRPRPLFRTLQQLTALAIRLR
jgi:glycosyltransferase involved in cell wall biosynthesis